MMGSVDHEHIVSIIEAIAQNNAGTILEIVAELAAQARDLETVLSELAETLHRVSLVQIAPEYKDPERSDWDSIVRLAEQLSPEDAQLFYQIAIQGARDLGIAPDPRTGLEMSLLRMLAFRPVKPGQAGGASTPKSEVKAAAKALPASAEASRVARPSVSKPVDEVSPGPQQQQELLQVSPDKPAKDPEDWHGLLPRLDLSGPVKELARNIQLESKSGDRWQFLIPDTVRHLGSDAMVLKLQTALSSQLGHPVDLALHTANEPVVTPAVVGEEAALQRMNEAELAIEQDPTVKALKERFGAEVVEDSVQPLQ